MPTQSHPLPWPGRPAINPHVAFFRYICRRRRAGWGLSVRSNSPTIRSSFFFSPSKCLAFFQDSQQLSDFACVPKQHNTQHMRARARLYPSACTVPRATEQLTTIQSSSITARNIQLSCPPPKTAAPTWRTCRKRSCGSCSGSSPARPWPSLRHTCANGGPPRAGSLSSTNFPLMGGVRHLTQCCDLYFRIARYTSDSPPPYMHQLGGYFVSLTKAK